jgi:hypothetical protein
MVTYPSGEPNAVHPEEAHRAVSKGERIHKRIYEMLHLGRTLKRYVRGYNNERSIGTSGRDSSGTISITEVALDANDNLITTETAASTAASIVGGASATRFSAGMKATMVLPS